MKTSGASKPIEGFPQPSLEELLKEKSEEVVADIMDWHYKTCGINFGVEEGYCQDATEIIDIVTHAITTAEQAGYERGKGEFKEKILKRIDGARKHIGYGDEDYEKPTLEDETWALRYESNAEVFFGGFDEGINITKNVINNS